jgi:hypothetical protein
MVICSDEIQNNSTRNKKEMVENVFIDVTWVHMTWTYALNRLDSLHGDMISFQGSHA